MKTRYYYLRDSKNSPLVTICLIEKDNIVGKGVAICSMLDLPNKKVGRTIARGKALKALGKQEHSEPIKRFKAIHALSNAYSLIDEYNQLVKYMHKSIFNPQLTAYETKLLGWGA